MTLWKPRRAGLPASGQIDGALTDADGGSLAR